MNLQEYNQEINSVWASTLPDVPKATALSLIAQEIRSCLWQPWAKSEALELAEKADSFSSQVGGESLEGLDYLAKKGLLKSK